ncbi:MULTISPECIES: hypothetical protein [Bradyrhizobium]|uniref:Terminase n=2 Tax=Bradyrhizobium TaxID=374 RepID=A0ABY0PK24_9BRAD|nr:MULTISPECIES: hypothetical protein [Bradyrhizobium]SDI55298.1 hypothetical protein SAMN05444163_3106 [Bradyrhizobium ottawaense]SED42177.1 hypothetical protein SAMN05444171_4063 [Bradyrhizobium lablabi]
MPLTKYKQPGKFGEVLDNIHTYGSLGKASRASAVDPWTLARWRRMSEAGDQDFQDVEYRGVIQPFHLHVEDAIENSVDEIESNFRATARDGYWRPVIWHGDYCFEPDEAAEAMSETEFQDAVELGLAWPDKKRRVKNEETGRWERVKITEWIAPSVDAQVKVLSSWSDRYADKRSLKLDMNVNQTLGVTVIGSRPSVAPPLPALETIPPEIAKPNETTSEAIYSEITNERSLDETRTDLAEQALVEQPVGTENLLDMEQRDILQRMRSHNPLARELAQKAEDNLKRRIAAGDPDVDPRRTGRGPTPTGFKVV